MNWASLVFLIFIWSAVIILGAVVILDGLNISDDRDG